MNSSQYKKNELKKLCSIIGFKPDEVIEILTNIDQYYRERIENKEDKKRGGFKRYKDGTIKKRTIRPSLKELKKIQSRIKDRILATIELPSYVHGGVKRRSNISNAKPHQGKKYQFTTDLQDFYPSITPRKVYDTFIGLGYSPHFAHWLTGLTTRKESYRKGHRQRTHIKLILFSLKLI